MEDKWPCIRCTADEFESEIRERLKRWGMIDKTDSYDWEKYNIVVLGTWNNDERFFCNSSMIKGDNGEYLCPDIPTFLHDCREIAIRKDWFNPKQLEKPKKEMTKEMKWKKRCPTCELPTRLQKLVEFHRTNGTSKDSIIKAFSWSKTPEGFVFWDNVYKGVTPDNLEAVLNEFEKEHPELLESSDVYNIKTPSKERVELKVRIKKPNCILTSNSNKKLFNLLK